MTPVLTGPYDTAQLTKITADPVTVTVSRTPDPARLDGFKAALEALRAACERSNGCLGAGVMRAGVSEESDWHLVTRFADPVSLRKWEHSTERYRLLAELAPYTRDVAVAAAVSPDAWLAGADAPRAGFKPVGWMKDVAWVFPVAFATSVFVGPHLTRLPLELRVLTSSVVVTVGLSVVISPVRATVRRMHRRRSPLR